MSKLVVIGIDALDRDLVVSYSRMGHLPVISKLMEEGGLAEYTSVIPPDSDTAWASIFTGMNPAEHGVVDFVDPVEHVAHRTAGTSGSRSLRGKTFWDDMASMGLRVCIILPHLVYPGWTTNGIMITRSPWAMDSPISVFPKDAADGLDLSGLTGLGGISGNLHAKEEYLHRAKNLLAEEIMLTLKVASTTEWDFLFTYSAVLDMVKHNFWSFCDKLDPAYPGPNRFETAILDLYKDYDKAIGRIVNGTECAGRTILLSDHGHGMRPFKLLNLNIILSQVGALSPQTNQSRDKMGRFAKERLIPFLVNLGAWEIMVRLVAAFPITKKVYQSAQFNRSKTWAYATDQSGIKAYCYGGIRIVREHLRDLDYETARSLIIEQFEKVKDPDSNKPIFRQIWLREDLYKGDFIESYPDIVFLLDDEWGAGWEIQGPLFSTSPTHAFVPGSHRISSPVLLVPNQLLRFLPSDRITPMDIKGFLLHCVQSGESSS